MKKLIIFVAPLLCGVPCLLDAGKPSKVDTIYGVEAPCLLQMNFQGGAVNTLLLNEAQQPERLDGDVAANRWQATDWLYTASPHSCEKPEWDMTQRSLGPRVLLPFLFCVLATFVVINGRVENKTEEAAGSADDQQFSSLMSPQALDVLEEHSCRRYDLDYARIICVACVVTEHSGGTHWARHNMLFSLQWVLPYLYLTSAIGWMMSTKGVWAYTFRLSIVLFVGVAVNFVADVVTHRNWRGDFGNTIFQMFYVVMLILMSMVTAPLRQALRQRKDNAGLKADGVVGWQLWTALVISGLITLLAFVAFFAELNGDQLQTLLPFPTSSWHSHLRPLMSKAPILFIQIGGILFLCHLACLFRANDLLPWLLILHIYIPRVFLPWELVGFVHNLELFVFGMVAESWSLRGHRTISVLLQNYWPVIVFIMMTVTMPDIYGRCDLIPPAAWLERLRFYGVELALCLFLSSGAMKVGDPWNATEWLNRWALYAYCFHVAWARIFPIPYGAVLTYCSSLLFYIAWRSGNGKRDTTQSSTGSQRRAQDNVAEWEANLLQKVKEGRR